MQILPKRGDDNPDRTIQFGKVRTQLLHNLESLRLFASVKIELFIGHVNKHN